MSVWRGREVPLDPIAGALVQLSNLAGGPGATCHPTLFTECLQQLQSLHDQQVSVLSGEVSRLRKEMDILRKDAKAVDFVAVPCKDVALPVPPLPVHGAADNEQPIDAAHKPSPRVTPRSALRKPARRRVADSSSQGADTTEQEDVFRGVSWVTGPGAKEEVPYESSKPSKDTAVKSLSEEVSKNVTHQLTQMKSEKSMVMVRTKSMLLDEYVTYRRLSRGGDSSGFVKRLVSSPKFDVCMGIIIVLNAVTIGLEAEMNRSGHEAPVVLSVSEYVFLLLYTVEIGLRLTALHCRALCNAWVQFDILLVCCGFLDIATTFFGTGFQMLDNVLLVRTFRLARLARVLRLMIKFHTLWMLVHGLLNSLMTLTWTCIIICILLFVFAVLGLELLQPDPSASAEYNVVAKENFGSLLKATTSLLQGLTLDSFGVIYRPVMLARPLTVFYFVPFLMVVSIALMNLVTALMVNFSLEQATKDRQAEEQLQLRQKSEVIRILEAAFAELDTDCSGQLELDEMLAAPEELRTLICQVADMGGADRDADLISIFKTLDFDNSGHLKIEDFCQGLMMLHDKKALESYFVLKNVTKVMKTIRPRRDSQDRTDTKSDRSSVGTENAAGDAAGVRTEEVRTEESLPPWM